MSKKNLYIIDGNYIIYRSHYALINLKNSSGMHTGAVFGFLKTIIKVISDKYPHYLIIAFDSKEKTFRDHVYTDYKINRAPMPNEIIEQIPIILEILDRLGIRYLIRDGYEADDIIGSLTEFASSKNLKSYIITRDKDMIQLMGDNTEILYCDEKWEIIDDNWVLNKFGIQPGQIVDYLSLVGDSSDHVPGVKGIGPKGAQKLLKEFSSLEEIYDNINRINDQKLSNKLLQEKDNAFLSKSLVTIVRDLEIDIDTDSLAVENINYENIYDILEEMEFFSLIKELNLNRQETKSISFEAVNSHKSCKQLADKIRKAGFFAFLSELDSAAGEIYTAVTTDGTKCNLLKTSSKPDNASDLESEVSDSLCGILGDADILKVSYELKDTSKLISPQNMYINIFDTGIAFSLLDPDSNTSLENLALRYLKRELKDDEAGQDQHMLLCRKACAIHDLWKIAKDRLKKEDLSKIFFDIEMPLIRIVAEMERYGIRIDTSLLKDLENIILEKIRETEAEIYDITGFEFNINSTKELQDILFNVLDLKGRKKGKTGYSTSIDVLKELSASHPLPRKIIEYRSLAKLLNTYVTVLPSLVDRETGRIHTSFNQKSIITGRLSSSSPNLQAIPIRGELGSQIRNAFISSDGYSLISADYSQIELRVLAHFSLDPVLIEAFMEDKDIHTITASALFAFDESMITPAMRRTAKAVNFGIIYGITPFGLSKQIGISQAESKHYIRLFFNRYKGVRVFIDRIIEKAAKDGYVKTLYGRKRPVPQLNSANSAMKKFGERISINTIIQGTAAEIIKIAMINLYSSIQNKEIDAKMILQIHDEILFEVKNEYVSDFINIIRKDMTENFSLNVPLKVNINYGKSWGEI